MPNWMEELNSGNFNSLSGNSPSMAGLDVPGLKILGKKKKKGFLTDQISTGGGIAGALAGGAAGAAAGSVVPVVGTAIGGIAGAILGGGLGSGAGEATENYITGDNLMDNVGKEALIGGATSLPFGAGFKLARAGVKATTGLGKTAASDLVQEAGLGTIGKSAVSKMSANGKLDERATQVLQNMQQRQAGKLGKAATNTADSIIASQSGMTASQARKMGMKPVDTFANIFNRTGLTKLDDMAEVSRNLTGNGQDSILDTLTRAAFENTKGVRLAPLRETAQNIMDDGTSLLSNRERTRVLENMKNADVAINGGSRGSLKSSGDALSALDQANAFRSLANSLKNGFSITPKDKQLARIYDGVAGDIERSLYGARGVSENVPALTKSGADDLLFKAQAAREAGNEAQAKAFESVATELRGVNSVKDIRSLKKDWVDIGKIDKATAEAQGARTLTGQQFSTNVANTLTSPKAILGAVVDATAPRAAGKVKDISGVLSKARPGQSILSLAARQGGSRGLLSDDISSQPLEGAQPEQIENVNPLQSTPDELAQEPMIGGYTQSQVQQAMLAALGDGNEDAYSQLKELYSMFPDDSEQKLNSSTAAMAAKQATTDQALESLLGQYEAAGGGQGKLGGGIAGALGEIGLNSNAAAYNDQLASTARLVSRALGETGAGSDADATAYISMLPRLSDTAEQAKIKMDRLRQLLAGARQNTLSYGLGSTPEASAGAY